jgi:hypothetical protein
LTADKDTDRIDRTDHPHMKENKETSDMADTSPEDMAAPPHMLPHRTGW